jgi:hypothetical protein
MMMLSFKAYLHGWHLPSISIKQSMSFKLLQAVLFTVCYLCTALPVQAERYSVEKDSFGNYNAKKVEKDKTAERPVFAEQFLQKTPATISGEELNAPEVTGSEQGVPLPTEAQREPLQHQSADDDELSSAADDQNVSMQDDSGAYSEQENKRSEPKKLSIFEQKYLEAEKAEMAEKQRILDALKAGEGKASDYDATEVNPEEYIDSEELLRSGGRAEPERSPYYVTVDADGTQRTVFYDPTLIQEIRFTERNQKLEFTDAQVYRDSESGISVPETADPTALTILSGGQQSFMSYFDKFAEKCCAQLPNIEVPDITLGTYHYFVLNDNSLPYRFAEGDSRFLLLSLPNLNQSQIPVRIRSFIRRFADRDIEKGVFFPQLVTLDKERKPLRIITGPLLKYQDETWTTHAYLQGIFALSQTSELDERYLLINTTREALKSSSTIEIPPKEDKPARTVVLQHMNEGSFEIEILQ